VENKVSEGLSKRLDMIVRIEAAKATSTLRKLAGLMGTLVAEAKKGGVSLGQVTEATEKLGAKQDAAAKTHSTFIKRMEKLEQTNKKGTSTSVSAAEAFEHSAKWLLKEAEASGVTGAALKNLQERTASLKTTVLENAAATETLLRAEERLKRESLELAQAKKAEDRAVKDFNETQKKLDQTSAKLEQQDKKDAAAIQKKRLAFAKAEDAVKKLQIGIEKLKKVDNTTSRSFELSAKAILRQAKAAGLDADQIGLLEIQINQARIALDKHTREVRQNTAAQTKNAKQIGRSSSRMNDFRLTTSGMQKTLGIIRNELLLLTFALGSSIAALSSTVKAAIEVENALLGLSAVAGNLSASVSGAKQAAVELAKDGLIAVSDAAAGLKNLLAWGATLDESVAVMLRFKDAAAFNRQGMLTMGQAVVGATEGVKNFLSRMVDNVGITRNLNEMLKEYARSIGTTIGKLDEVQRRQGILNGIMKDGALFTGNAALAMETLSGQSSRLTAQIFMAKAAIGDTLTPAIRAFNEVMASAIKRLQDYFAAHKLELIETFRRALIALKPELLLLKALLLAVVKALQLVVENLDVLATVLSVYVIVKLGSLVVKLYAAVVASNALIAALFAIKFAFASLGIGLIVAAFAGLVYWISQVKTENERLLEGMNETIRAQERRVTGLNNYISVLSRVKGKEEEVKEVRESLLEVEKSLQRIKFQRTLEENRQALAKFVSDTREHMSQFGKIMDEGLGGTFFEFILPTFGRSNYERIIGESLGKLSTDSEEATEKLKALVFVVESKLVGATARGSALTGVSSEEEKFLSRTLELLTSILLIKTKLAAVDVPEAVEPTNLDFGDQFLSFLSQAASAKKAIDDLNKTAFADLTESMLSIGTATGDLRAKQQQWATMLRSQSTTALTENALKIEQTRSRMKDLEEEYNKILEASGGVAATIPAETAAYEQAKQALSELVTALEKQDRQIRSGEQAREVFAKGLEKIETKISEAKEITPEFVRSIEKMALALMTSLPPAGGAVGELAGNFNILLRVLRDLQSRVGGGDSFADLKKEFNTISASIAASKDSMAQYPELADLYKSQLNKVLASLITLLEAGNNGAGALIDAVKAKLSELDDAQKIFSINYAQFTLDAIKSVEGYYRDLASTRLKLDKLVADKQISSQKAAAIEAKASAATAEAAFKEYTASVLDMIAQQAAAKATFKLLDAMPGGAPALFALSAALGGAAALLRSSAASDRAGIQAEIDAARRENEEDDEAAKEDEEARSREFGGSVQIKDTVININPVVSINGEIVVIGTMGVEELSDTIGMVSVRAVKDAIETGEIDLSPVGAA
tara:strand:+ start:83 stop:4081 length:3999 start_codon:yes stop_codon:yes gene_type:complete